MSRARSELKYSFPKRKPTISTTNDIRDVLKKCSFDTWVVLDLDNTVMHPRDDHEDLGSDQWFEHVFQHAMSVMSDSEQAKKLVMTVYNEVQKQTIMQPVDKKIALIIARLQQIGIPVIALTARGFELADSTAYQLRNINIGFSRVFGILEQEMKVKGNQITYKYGIIFCAGSNKGDALTGFFDSLKVVPGLGEAFSPKHVLMVDDKVKHVKSVHDAVIELDGNFDGLHFTHLEERVISFEIHRPKRQLSLLYPNFSAPTQVAIDELKLLQEVKSESAAGNKIG